MKIRIFRVASVLLALSTQYCAAAVGTTFRTRCAVMISWVNDTFKGYNPQTHPDCDVRKVFSNQVTWFVDRL